VGAAGAPAPGADPGERAGEAAALSAALAALPAQDRAAVLMVDRDGMSYARAGEVLGVPAGTVASRLNRARAALRAALGDER
jgi:RNA polymerase sigma-70 factor (ECF subfamily)